MKQGRDLLYAHWLDGEWIKVAKAITVEGYGKTLESIAEAALKLLALLGSRVAISDVQLTDSPVVLNLFSDPDFLSYLAIDQSFLTLVASPRQGISDGKLARATRGLERAMANTWSSSLPGMHANVIRTFADTLLNADMPETGKWLRAKSEGPRAFIEKQQKSEDRRFLVGMLNGICHFSKKSGGPSESPFAHPRSYIDLLEECLQNESLKNIRASSSAAALDDLKKIRSTIATLVPEESERYKRSSLLRAFEEKQPDRSKWLPHWHQVWNTVIHFSNSCAITGVTRSQSASGAVLVPFRGEHFGCPCTFS